MTKAKLSGVADNMYLLIRIILKLRTRLESLDVTVEMVQFAVLIKF